MAQTDLPEIIASTDTGSDLATWLNAWKETLYSTNAGSGRPSYAVAGTLWIDTTTPELHTMYLFDGTQDQELGSWNPSEAGSLALGTTLEEVDFSTDPDVVVGQMVFDVSPTGGMTYFGYSNPGGSPVWIPIVDIRKAVNEAVDDSATLQMIAELKEELLTLKEQLRQLTI